MQNNERIDTAKTFKIRLMKVITFFLIVFVVLIAALILHIISSQAKGKVPFVGKYAWLRIETPSMEDTLPVGSFILIKKVSPDKIKVGDIITFYSEDPSIKGYPNTHRVVEINNVENKSLVFTTKGDNNPIVDEYKVSEDNLIGIYVRNLPILSFISRMFRTKAAFLLLVVPALILVALSLKDVFSAAKDIKTEKSKEELIREEVERLKKEAEENKNNVENGQT